MRCSDIENRLPAYMEDLLSTEERKIITGHLASCPRCSLAFAGLKKAEQLVRDLKEVEPPPFFEQRIMSRVREEAGRKRGILRRLFYPLHIKVPIQALATLLVAVIAIHVYQAGEPEMKQVAPLPIPMTEPGKGRVADEPPNAFISPSAPTPAKRVPPGGGDLPEKSQQRFAAPPPENGRKEEKRADSRAPMREAHPSAAKPAGPLMAARELEEKSADLRAPMREARPSVVKPTDPVMTVREKEISSVGEDALDKPRGKAGVQHAEKAFEAAPPAQQRKEKTGDAGAASRESIEMRSAPSPPRKTGIAAIEKRSAIDLTIQVRDTDVAIREIEARLGQVNARIIERQLRKGSEFLKAEIAAPNVAVLMDLLGAIGRVNLETSPLVVPEGHATVSIKIVSHP
jgi:hypothetical protein